MAITHEDQYDYEREIEFEIAGSHMVLPIVISEMVIEADVWHEPGNVKDYDTRWIAAKVQIVGGSKQPAALGDPHGLLWEDLVSRSDLDVVKNLADATLSDILDEIAEEAFLRDYRAGEIA